MSSLDSPDVWGPGNLAAYVPNRRVLAMDMEGHGRSTPVSSRTSVDLCMRRSTRLQAEPLVDTALSVLGDEAAVADYVGVSHGARLCLEYVRSLGGSGTVCGVDLPAVSKQNTVAMQYGYIRKDNHHGRKEYAGRLNGTQLERDFDEFAGWYDDQEVERSPNFAIKNPKLFMMNLVRSVNAGNGSLALMRDVLDTTSVDIRLMTSGRGSVSNPEAIRSFMETLPPDQADRMSQLVLPNEDHNIGYTPIMQRIGQWAASQFETA